MNEGGTNWGDVALLVNNLGLQWYATLADKDVAPSPYLPGTPIPTQTYSDTTRMLIVGMVVVAVIVLANR
jgi:hypothetical protein